MAEEKNPARWLTETMELPIREIIGNKNAEKEIIDSKYEIGKVMPNIVIPHKIKPKGGKFYVFVKRFFDIVCSFIAIIVLSPLMLLTALLVRNYLSSYIVNGVTVKWPNDVYVNDKKICGILLQGQYPDYLVIGIGINVNQKEFNGEYRTTPTSLFLETNQINDLDRFKRGLYIYIDEHLDLFKKGLYNPINEIRQYNYLKGKETDLGKVVDINDNYSLKVETEDGFENIISGEVNI